MKQVTSTIVNAFLNGKAMQISNSSTDGQSLYLFGNKIAEHKPDGLYITNCGYFTATTKERLNALPGVYISQRQFKWYLKGEEWTGEWTKVNDSKPPEVDKTKIGKTFDLSRKYVKTDGWRGYEEPVFAVCGANDTGMWSDSPCPSNVSERELNEAKQALNGIPSKLITTETSNVFCVHHYLVVPPVYFEDAKVKIQNFIDNNETRLLYAVK